MRLACFLLTLLAGPLSAQRPLDAASQTITLVVTRPDTMVARASTDIHTAATRRVAQDRRLAAINPQRGQLLGCLHDDTIELRLELAHSWSSGCSGDAAALLVTRTSRDTATVTIIVPPGDTRP